MAVVRVDDPAQLLLDAPAGMPATPPETVAPLSRGYRLWRPHLRGALGAYYVDFVSSPGIRGEDWARAPRDERGALIGPGGSRDPVAIAQYGLFEHARFVRGGEERARTAFLAQAAWLRDAIADDGALVMPETCPITGAAPGYCSARAQGEAISVLLRANEATPSEGFFEAAVRATRPFARTIDDGGVVWRGRGGDTFLEGTASARPAHVLADCIVALWGLFEFERAVNTAWVGDVIGSTIGTLQRRLAFYDSGYWSYEHALASASGRRTVASPRAHDFQIALLRVTASMVGDPFFDSLADAWHAYVFNQRCRRRAAANRSLAALAQPWRGAVSTARGVRAIF